MNIAIDVDLILKPLSDNRVGEDLTYSTISDEIKDARINEDENVSRGVWERDLKKADWKKVVRLSYDVLCNQSKDLQIIGWLCEGLVANDRLPGLVHALDILHGFLQEYWVDCYPKNEDNGFDYVYKTNILQWIANTLNRKISEVRILDDSDITIDIYDYAVNVDMRIQQNPDQRRNIIESATQSGYISIPEFKREFAKKISGKLDEYNALIDGCKDAVKKLNDFVDSIHNADVYFGDLSKTIEKLELFLKFKDDGKSSSDNASKDGNTPKKNNYKNSSNSLNLVGDYEDTKNDSHQNTDNAKEKIQPVENKSLNDDFVVLPYSGEGEQSQGQSGEAGDTHIKTYSSGDRDAIYDQLKDIASKLHAIDPHSPSYYFIKLVSTWKNKTLAEIILDIKDGNSDVTSVLKIFAGL